VSGELLKITSGKAAGGEIVLEDELVIGRTVNGEGTLADDSELSRRHARITRVNGKLLLEDLGSTNGTFLNGQRIAAPSELHRGDKIAVGNSTLELVIPGGAGRETQVAQRPAVEGRPTAVNASPVRDPDATSARPVVPAGASARVVEPDPAAAPAPREPTFPRFTTRTQTRPPAPSDGHPGGGPPPPARGGGPPKALVPLLLLVVGGGLVALILALTDNKKSDSPSSSPAAGAVADVPSGPVFTAMAQGTSTTTVRPGQPTQLASDLTFVVGAEKLKNGKAMKLVDTGKATPFRVHDATYTLTASDGGTLVLAAEGVENPPSPLLPDHYMSDSDEVWSVRSGTGRFAGARGDGHVQTAYVDVKKGDPSRQAVVAVFKGRLILAGGGQ
jgi:pSer/pThr/pTyr-binding forkhead associated (FHA) protein